MVTVKRWSPKIKSLFGPYGHTIDWKLHRPLLRSATLRAPIHTSLCGIIDRHKTTKHLVKYVSKEHKWCES